MPVNVYNKNEIVLYGDVGDFGWGNEYFTAGEVVDALNRVGPSANVLVRLNSGGGALWQGSGIHSALSRHRGNVEVLIEGIAASAASLLAMGGNTVSMASGSLFMLHEPSALTLGTEADHNIQAKMLGVSSETMAELYAAKSGRSIAECRADMANETWLSATEAVSLGYADRVVGGDGKEAAPFAYAAYRRPPVQLVALAAARKWPTARKERAVKSYSLGARGQTERMHDAHAAATPAASKAARQRSKADMLKQVARLPASAYGGDTPGQPQPKAAAAAGTSPGRASMLTELARKGIKP